jgi:flagellar hook-associated protein 2
MPAEKLRPQNGAKNMAGTSSLDLSISGLASGLDWKTVVLQLAQAARAPETQWKQRQIGINQKNATFGVIKGYLTALQADVQKLKDSTLYDSRTALTSAATIGTASADAGATLGAFAFKVIHLATAAQVNGSSNIGRPISENGDLSAVTVGTAGFATAVTAGTFTVNGKQVTLTPSDSLQQVFDSIASATHNAVAASYDFNSDKITLSSSDNSEIVLGSATDTSNFLQVTQLYNNGTGSISSASALGSVRVAAAMADSGLRTAITDDGNGAGEFKINGVSITYNASADSLQNVLDRITNSSAGVTATYDAIDDRFVLTNKSGGDVGIALEEVSGKGNFLTATGLTGGTLAHGQNLTYSINGGPERISQSNTISPGSSGIAGLSFTALAEGEATITVASDTEKVKAAIVSFIASYNKLQSYLADQSAVSTDSSGRVTAGLLAGDLDASRIATSLRSLSFSPVPLAGLSSALDQLADLGIQTNGRDNTIELGDSAALDEALANRLNHVKALFSDAADGWAVPLDAYLTRTIGDDGTLVRHQASLTEQSTHLDTQIAALEKLIAAESAQWTRAFQAMEAAQAQINQQLAYLSQQITNWNA